MKLKTTKLLFTTIFLTITQLLIAQAPTYDWTQTFGNNDYQYGFDITSDVSGNSITTGYFQGTVDFDPGVGVFNLTSAGGYDVFVVKLDPNGNFVWAVRMGGASGDRGHAVATDNNENVFVSGRFQGTADFDPGSGTTNFSSNGADDIFVLKLDPNGNFDWAKHMGGTGSDQGRGITVDGSNNVLTTGLFNDAIDLNPNAGTMTANSNGDEDFFIQKLDNAGNFLWANATGGNGLEEGWAIATDSNNDVYVTGFYSSYVDFDPGAGTAFMNIIGFKDIFIQKLDANGNYVWSKRFGGSSIDEAYGIATDSDNNVYTTGFFQNTMDLDPGPGTDNKTSNGSYDAFIQKLDVNGNYIWGKNFGGSSVDYCNSIDVDDNGNVYTTGLFYSTADFDPGIGTTNTSSLGQADIFIHSLYANGDFAWVQALGGNSFNEGRGINIFNNSTIYSTGHFQQAVDFDPGTGSDSRPAVNNNDAYVHKMTQCIADYETEVIEACGSYTWSDGNTYTSNASPTQTFTNVNGCDSIITLNLTINQPNTGTHVQTACDSYIWIDGNTYTSDNNTATHTLTNQVGCDSVVTLDLTINNSNTGTDVQTACDSYVWIDGNTYTSDNNTATHTLTNAAGCDSIVTLDLTINNSNTGTDVQTACDSYVWIDGNTYTSDNNTATHTLTNAAGCDSIVTLDLTINNSTTGTDVQTACDSYMWIDGNTYTSDNNTATHTLVNADGCDSIVTLDLTISNSTTGTDVQTKCDTYTWIDGNTYTSDNNTATHTLTNAAGCDSVVTLDLTIENVSNLTVNQNDNILAADLSGASYQWIDCGNNDQLITGANSQIYTAPQNGDYAVIITEGNCTDTSDCLTVSTMGLATNKWINNVVIYPNPTTGTVHLKIGKPESLSTVIVRNIYGQNTPFQIEHFNEEITIRIEGDVGIYFIELMSESGVKQAYKVIKK
jgi:hypothetical protein